VTAAAPPTTAATPAITTPWFDALCVGGASLLFFVPLFGLRDATLPKLFALTALINIPHFMGSYWLLYTSKDLVLRHKWAAIYVPILMWAYLFASIAVVEEHPIVFAIGIYATMLYTGWHYVAQAWGMLASFAHMSKFPFVDRERKLIRWGLALIFVWYATWLTAVFPNFKGPDWVHEGAASVYSFACVVIAPVALGLGVAGMGLFRRRTQRLPTSRGLLAWIAIYVWFGAIAAEPKALFYVQIAHCLQYLIFPARVELNRCRLRESNPKRVWVRFVAYLVGLVVLGNLLFLYLPGWLSGGVGYVLGTAAGEHFPTGVFMLINAHHFFSDGCLWKLREPAVRRELFSHIQGPKSAAPSEPSNSP
jgi:hypothetical protein